MIANKRITCNSNGKRTEKNRIHPNTASVNGFVIAVILFIVFVDKSCAKHTDTHANNTIIAINCPGLETCIKCTQQVPCLWSLERQACIVDYGTPQLHNMVRIETGCPRMSAVSKVTYKSHLPYRYSVKVSNDVVGFMSFMEQTRVSCIVLNVTRPAKVYGDTISCAPLSKSDLGFDQQPLMTYHCYVVFGKCDTVLRLDDGADSYFSVYDEFSYGYRPEDRCVSCLWNADQYAYYYKWCPSRDIVTGQYMFYAGYSETDHNVVLPEDQRLAATVPASSGCADVRIQSVEPTTAPWTGGLSIRITVNNHAILADGGGNVSVTVAGRECARPTMMDRGTGITCVLTAAGAGDDAGRQIEQRGPVRITYQPSSLTVESSQTFRFVYPEITNVSPSCGPLTGGTLLTIRGKLLNTSSSTAVAVADGVPCEVIASHSNRILCLTGPSDWPVAGAVSAVFDRTLRIQNGTFTYTTGPTLAADQKFGGIASGGTAVPVRGTGFGCIHDATMYVDHGGARWPAAGHCRLVSDTYMVCGTPKLQQLVGQSLPELLRFGFRVRQADGHVFDMSPPPNADGYVVYADPVFDDFSVDDGGRTVFVNGYALGNGYRVADVKVVRISDNLTAAACDVTTIVWSHIVCESVSLLHDVHALVVTVGDQFTRTLKANQKSIVSADTFGQILVVSLLLLMALVYFYKKYNPAPAHLSQIQCDFAL